MSTPLESAVHRQPAKGAGTRCEAAAVLDRAALMERLGHDPALLQEIARLYFEETPRLVTRMREALAADALEEARSTVHRLRGMLSTLGADASTVVAEALEAELAAGATSGARRLLESLTRELGKLERALADVEPSASPRSPEIAV